MILTIDGLDLVHARPRSGPGETSPVSRSVYVGLCEARRRVRGTVVVFVDGERRVVVSAPPQGVPVSLGRARLDAHSRTIEADVVQLGKVACMGGAGGARVRVARGGTTAQRGLQDSGDVVRDKNV